MAQKAYRDRHPHAPMGAPGMLEIIDLLEGEGIDVWIDGGWGVDALLGRETRPHDDLDLVAELRDSERIIELLHGLGHHSSRAPRRRASSWLTGSDGRSTSTQ